MQIRSSPNETNSRSGKCNLLQMITVPTEGAHTTNSTLSLSSALFLTCLTCLTCLCLETNFRVSLNCTMEFLRRKELLKNAKKAEKKKVDGMLHTGSLWK